MPHVIVKLWPGRNDEIKSNLAKRIAHTVALRMHLIRLSTTGMTIFSKKKKRK